MTAAWMNDARTNERLTTPQQQTEFRTPNERATYSTTWNCNEIVSQISTNPRQQKCQAPPDLPPTDKSMCAADFRKETLQGNDAAWAPATSLRLHPADANAGGHMLGC